MSFLSCSIQVGLSAKHICIIVHYANYTVTSLGDKMCCIVMFIVQSGSPISPTQSGSSNFGEKFSRVKFSPSLTLFGGKPMEGWLAVTVSGLVTVSLLKPGGALLTASESLCRLRGRVALADIAFTGGGNIVVAATDGSSSSPVQFYKVRTRSRTLVPWSLVQDSRGASWTV